MDWLYKSSALFATVSSQLWAKLDSFLCDGLELVVSSPVHVEIVLYDRRKTKHFVSKEERKKSKEKNKHHNKYKLAETVWKPQLSGQIVLVIKTVYHK